MSSMYLFLFAVIILGFILFILSARQTLKNPEIRELTRDRLPYRRKDYLFSVTEKPFFELIVKIAAKYNCYVFAKVRLEDLLWLPANVENRFGLRNRIKSRHIDFVVCNVTEYRPLIAVELDGASHERADRIERDHNIDQILGDAGLPIVHIRVSPEYNPLQLEEQLKEALLKYK